MPCHGICQGTESNLSFFDILVEEERNEAVLNRWTNSIVLEKTEAAVVDSESLTAEEFARLAGVAVVLAKERLLAAENMGRLCRDDSIEGLRFYPNLFLCS